MNILFYIFILFYIIFSANSQGLFDLIGPFRLAKLTTFNLLRLSIENEGNTRLLKQRNKLQPFINESVSFPCDLNNARSKNRPDSVNKLRPGDIDVVAGIGDSLTAGVGLLATNPLQIGFEHREMGPTAGGAGNWRQILTVPNLLKEFNPNLVGYASHSSLTIHPESQFNLGETGSLSEDTPYMANVLIRRMRSHPKVNIRNDWKMVSYMIGPNNFCTEICFQPNLTALLEKHRKEVVKVLRILKNNLPRTIVNLIPSPSVKILIDLVGKSKSCSITHLVECPCLFGHRSSDQKMYVEFMKTWQKVDIEVANDEEFDTRDFTVVSQPFTIHFFIPKINARLTDFSYLSEDCFHMSQKGNARIALSLWNNLFEPVGQKTPGPSELIKKINCPSKDNPFIFTRRNSKKSTGS